MNSTAGPDRTVVLVSGRDGQEGAIGVGFGGSLIVRLPPTLNLVINLDGTGVSFSGRDGQETGVVIHAVR